MMRQCLRFLGIALLSVLVAFPKQSSGMGCSDSSDGLDFEGSRGFVMLDVVVNDRSGNPVLGLRAEDFDLFDNGQRQNITSFQRHEEQTSTSECTVETVFLMDSLNLTSEQVARAKSQLANFLRENDGHLRHPAMVYRLSTFGLSAIEQPSTDGNKLADEVVKDRESRMIWAVPPHPQGAPRPDAGQARNEASLKALGAIAIEERKRPSRKLLFWVGPGWPTEQGGHYSFAEIVELSTRLREARLTLFGITAWAYPKREFSYEEYLKGVKSEKDARTDDVSLEVLATKSGGVVTAPAFDLQGTIARLVDHANNFYSVSFDPPKTNRTDEYHELKITVNGRDAIPRTNSEYYDQPSYTDQPATVKRLSAQEFANELRTHLGQSDVELARYLSAIELTERLGHEAFAAAISLMRGKRSKDALISLVDQSTFYPPSAAEIPQIPAPDSTQQSAIVHRLKQYLTIAIPNMPNLYATRTTLRYSEPRQQDEQAWKTIHIDQSLHQFGTERLTVLVRNSKEVTESASAAKQPTSRDRNLFSEGAFGPILSMVSDDITGPNGMVEWGRWEAAGGSRLAVFRFTVQDGSTDFEVGFCCLLQPDGTLPYKRKTAYHGEMAVNPQTGAISRIWIEADLPERLPIVRTAFAVEFGAVVIGGKTYVCPTKSVYISRGRTVKMLKEWDQTFAVFGPFQTLLNDVTFTKYHVFRSNHRILTNYSPGT